MSSSASGSMSFHGEEAAECTAAGWRLVVGLLGATFVSLLGAVGAAIVLARPSVVRRLTFVLTCCSVAALVGNSMFELLPVAFGGHDHEHGGAGCSDAAMVDEGSSHGSHDDHDDHDDHDEHGDEEVNLPLRGLLVVAGLAIGALTEAYLHHHASVEPPTPLAATSKLVSSSSDASSAVSASTSKSSAAASLESGLYNDSDDNASQSAHHHGHYHGHGDHDADHSHPLGMLAVVLDSVCNLADGVVIGLGFAISLASGLAATIAISLHELPQEMGDIAVMLAAGMSVKKAVALNVTVGWLATATGVVIGFLVSGDAEIDGMLFAAAGGMYLYLSLAVLAPFIHQRARTMSRKWVAIAVGAALVVVTIMFLIGVYEEDLNHGLTDLFSGEGDHDDEEVHDVDDGHDDHEH